jgi:hypothetical protein
MEWAMTRPYLRGGDTIRIRGGVYRPVAEASPSRDSTTDDTLIRPTASGEAGRPITVMAEPGENVTLSGRFLAGAWPSLAQGSSIYYYDYTTPLSFPFDHPFQVVEDGRLLYRAASLASLDRPGRCFVDTGLQRIYVWTSDGQPPSQHQLEYGASATGIEFRGGVRYWRLSGVSLAGFRSAGVLIDNGAGAIELDHLDIGYIGAQRPGADPTNGYALAVYDTSGGNSVHDNNLHHTLAEAVHMSQTGAGGDVYENNDIHEAGGPEWKQEAGYGQTLFGPGLILRGNRVTVRGNRIYNNGYHGLILESDLRGSEGPSAPSDNIIEGNVLAFNGGNGIYGDGKNGAAASRNDIIRFNLFDQNNQARSGSPTDAELRLGGNLDGTLIYNNTIYAAASNGVLLFATSLALGTGQGAGAVPSRVRLINNIAVEASTAPFLYPLRVTDLGPVVVADFNNWYRPAGGALVSWTGTDYLSLDLFRSKTGQEPRGMSADPRFVSPENKWFWLRAVSPMIGRAAADVLGGGSPMAATPDLGAFPYRPLLHLSPSELRFVTLFGSPDPSPQVVRIQSAGPMALNWSAATDAPGWLRLSLSSASAASASPAAGATPADLSIAVRAAGLSVGTHSATIQITPAFDGEPALNVRVTLVVLPVLPRGR